MHLRAVGVGDGRGQIADDGEAGVFQAHRGVVLGPFLADDGILEAGLLKGGVPVVDAGDEVGAPLLGCGGVDVIDNLFLGLDQFAALHLLDVGAVFGLQAPAGDELLDFHLLLVVGEDAVAVGEVAYAGVEDACPHGFLGQQHHGGVQSQGDGPCFGGRQALVACAVGADGAYLDIDGIAVDAFDVAGPVALRTSDTHGRTIHVGQGKVVLAHDEVAHVDFILVLRRAAFQFERLDDGVDGAVAHGLADGVEGVGLAVDDAAAEDQVFLVG